MELALEERKREIRTLLPHLPPTPGENFGVKLYPWQRTFFDSPAKVKLLCAANQIGKSSIGMRRHVANATDPLRWKQFFRRDPKMFWYLYPDSETLKREWETKWVGEWMPRGKMERDPQYGWKVEKQKSVPTRIEWSSGVSTFFLYYSKKRANMQAATVDDITCDEELPVDLYDEIMFRLTNTEGAFNMVFTPTLNQLFWKMALEKASVLPEALKLTVSMYDCLRYEDGSPSTAFTIDKIKSIEAKCQNKTEVLRRVHGKFVTEEGRTYFAFDPEKNMCKPRSFKHCLLYASVDGGSGGDGEKKAHPAAITFIAVEPDYRSGYVVAAWRGDGVRTTDGDVMDKYLEMKKRIGMPITQSWFDPASVDFGIIANRIGESFTPANKARDSGQRNLNTLFKYEMLYLFDDDGEIAKAAGELMSLMKTHSEGANKRGDDLSDALRYNAIDIPWDFDAVERAAKLREKIQGVIDAPSTKEDFNAIQIRLRRGEDVYGDKKENGWEELDQEIDHWNSTYEP